MTVNLPGQIGAYRVTERIGRGAMGVVYRAIDSRNDREVALKVMLPDFASDENARSRFLREAEAISRLQHRNIVTVYECGVVDDSPFIAMELLRGSSLAARLALPDPMTLEASISIVNQLCDGLQFAHDRGIVHRDVKPANVWLLKNGGVKLLDFGIAKLAGSTLTHGGGVVGSAAYMSPEQFGGGEVDSRADVFSTGAVLYEMLARRKAFEGESVTAVMHRILHEAPAPLAVLAPNVPRDVAHAVETALQKDPEQRYATVADLGDELRLAQYAMSSATDATVVARRDPVESSPMPAATPVAPSKPAPAPAPAPEPKPVAAPPPPPLPPRISQGPEAPRPAARPVSSPEKQPDPRPEARPAAVSAAKPVTTKVPAWATSFDPRVIAAAVVIGALVGVLVVVTLPSTVSSPPTSDTTPAPASGGGAPGQGQGGPTTPGQRRVLRILSEPPGAQVFIDGRSAGVSTPSELALADPPPSVVELRLGSLRQKIALTKPMIDRGELRVSLTAAPPGSNPVAPVERTQVMVHVTGNYPFEVGGCDVSSAAATEHDLQVAAPCIMRLRAPTYFLDTTRSIEASSGRVDISAPQLARVELRTRYEWCTVILNGRAVGSQPVRVDLAAGSYTATIQCPEKTYTTRAFTIDPGVSTRRLDDELLP